jgi:hypothetical protein
MKILLIENDWQQITVQPCIRLLKTSNKETDRLCLGS